MTVLGGVFFGYGRHIRELAAQNEEFAPEDGGVLAEWAGLSDSGSQLLAYGLE
jgi:hypothetical protein